MFCAHCHDKIPHGLNIALAQQGSKPLQFCCHACLQVYQLLKSTASEQGANTHNSENWQLALDNQMYAANFYIEGMHCTACAKLIQLSLDSLAGVQLCKVNYSNKQLSLIYDSNLINPEQILETVNALSYKAWPYQQAILAERKKAQKERLISKLSLALILSLQISMFALLGLFGQKLGFPATYAHFSQWLAVILFIPLWFYCTLPILHKPFIHISNYQLIIKVLLLIGSASFAIFAANFHVFSMLIPASLLGLGALFIHLRR